MADAKHGTFTNRPPEALVEITPSSGLDHQDVSTTIELYLLVLNKTDIKSRRLII